MKKKPRPTRSIARDLGRVERIVVRLVRIAVAIVRLSSACEVLRIIAERWRGWLLP